MIKFFLMNNTETVGYVQDKKKQVISIAILAFMFFIFGFVSWVNAILIPYFKLLVS
jgi:fucose permease